MVSKIVRQEFILCYLTTELLQMAEIQQLPVTGLWVMSWHLITTCGFDVLAPKT